MIPVEILTNIAGYVKTVHDKTRSYGTIFEKTYPDINAFAAISNGLVLVAELLDYYYDRWRKQKKQHLEQKDEEKIMTICKWSYMHAFSIIEHISKELVKKKNPKEFEHINNCFREGKRVEFSRIIKRSQEINLINDNEMMVWDILKEIRNSIVHNNAIMDRDGMFEIDSVRIRFERGKELEGDLNLALVLIEIMTKSYYQWVQKIIRLT